MNSIQQALKLLSEKNIMSLNTAQRLYDGICKTLGLKSVPIFPSELSYKSTDKNTQ